MASAQLEADNWIFAGGGNYINFNKATQAVTVTPPANANLIIGGTTYSDKNGQLLFYTEGSLLCNRLFQRFPSTSVSGSQYNGFLFNATFVGGQKVLAIPYPGSDSKYILFHIYYQLFTNYKSELLYSVIDMKLDSGRGGVDSFQRNLPIFGPIFSGTNVLFKLTAVQHCNKKDIWVVGHYANSDKYFSLLVTANGITSPPVISTGSFIPSYNSEDSLWHPSLGGYIKISPLGNKIAASFKSPDYIELGDFNTQTGVVSNIKKLTASPPPADTVYNPSYSYRIKYGVAGVEFSPSGDRLYAASTYLARDPNSSGIYYAAFIYQFNASLPTEAQIQSSKYFIDSLVNNESGAIQLANTGKLYINVRDNLCEVANPELLGAACNYTPLKLMTLGSTIGLELPNIMQSFLRYPMITTGNCQFQNIDFYIQNPIGVSSVVWDFGDPLSGSNNSSTSFTPTHIYSAQGYYEVKAILQNANGCGADTIRKIISAGPFKVYLGNDTTICQGDTLELKMYIPGATNSWSNNSGDTVIRVTQPGTYWVKVDLGDCTASDTINIAISNLPQFSLGNDTVICNNTSVTLIPNPVYPGSNYLWNTNASTGSINANTAGQYWLQVTDNAGCKWKDTINVSFKTLPNYNLGPDVSICDKDSVILNAAVSGATSYLWNTGATASNIKAFTTNIYWCDVNKDGCVYRDSVTVDIKPLPVVNFGPDLTLCEDNTVLLDATNSNATYLWQDNSTNPAYLVKQAGKYHVIVNKQNCFAKDTIVVSYNLKPVFTLGPDQPICNGTAITLNPQINNVSYLWQDGSVTPSYTVIQPGLYFLTATNNCGSKSDSVLVTKGVCKLYIPNAFTPNGDNKNDLFKASFGENITEYSMQVFNRYGELVFESKDKSKGWDGTYKGSRQPKGSFIWVIKYRTNTDVNLQQLKGSILLIR